MEDISLARGVVAESHLEMAKALKSRIETRGSSMSSDVREFLWAMALSHQAAAASLVESAKADVVANSVDC